MKVICTLDVLKPLIFIVFQMLFQAVLRALYSYFADRPLQEIPHIEVIDKVLIAVYLVFKNFIQTTSEFFCRAIFKLFFVTEAQF